MSVDPHGVRDRARARVVTLARSLLLVTDQVTEEFVRGLASEADLTPAAFRALFPTTDDLIRAVSDDLVRECVERLRAVARDVEEDAVWSPSTAARLLAEAWPIDWAAVTIRAKARAAALTRPALAGSFLEAERLYAPAILEVLEALLARMGRRFTWPRLLAARVIILTYERSFEAWLMSGGEERSFPESPFIRDTLPQLLEQMSEPAA